MILRDNLYTSVLLRLLLLLLLPLLWKGDFMDCVLGKGVEAYNLIADLLGSSTAGHNFCKAHRHYM